MNGSSIRMSHTSHVIIQFGRLKAAGTETYFAFLVFSALIFAHRAFAARDILARPAADMVLLRIVTRWTAGMSR